MCPRSSSDRSLVASFEFKISDATQPRECAGQGVKAASASPPLIAGSSMSAKSVERHGCLQERYSAIVMNKDEELVTDINMSA